MDQTGGANGSCTGEGSAEPIKISSGAHSGPSSTSRAQDGDILRPPLRRPRGVAAAVTAAPPRSEPTPQPCGARPRGAPGPCPPPGPLHAGARCHRTGTGDTVAASLPVPRDQPLLPVPVQPPRLGPGGGAGPAFPSGSCRSRDPRGPPPAAGTRGPGGGGRRGQGEGPRERSGHGAVLRGARHSPGRRGRAGPGRAGQPVPARRGRARALRGRRSPRPVRVPGAVRPRAGRGCQRRGGAGRCGAGLAGDHGGCGGLRACGPQCRGRGPVTNLRPPHRAVPLDVPHGAGEAPRPPPRSAARPAGYRAGGGSGPGGGHPAAASPGWGATRPPGLDRRVRVLSTGRPHCARGHPPSHGRARRWAPGGGYRAEGNGAGGSGASGTETEDSRAGDIGTAGNGAACAALAVRCPSGSARCRAPGAARAWSERPPPLPPPPPSFSSPRCGASVAPRCGSRCPGAGSGGRVCARGVCALGSPRAEPLRSVPCRTPGAAASRPPPLPGPRRARSPLPPSPRSLPRSLPAPARSLSGPAPPRGPGRAARRDPQSAGRLGGSRPRRTDYGSRQPARPRLALALTLRLPLPVSPPPPPLPPNRRSQRPGSDPPLGAGARPGPPPPAARPPREAGAYPPPRAAPRWTPAPAARAPRARAAPHPRHTGASGGERVVRHPPPGRPDGISMETVPGHPRGRRWGGAGGVYGLGGPATSCGGTAAGARRALTAPGGGQRAAAAAPLPAPRRRGGAAALPGTAAVAPAPAAPAVAGAVRGVPRRGGAAAQRGAPGAAVGRRRRALVEFGGVARARPGRRCARGRFGCGCRPAGCRAVAEEPSPGAARPPPPPCPGLPRCGSAGARPRLPGLRDAPPGSGPGGNC